MILIQKILKGKGLYTGKIDGIIGPKTLSALSQIDRIENSWSQKRKIIAAIQVFAIEQNIPAEPVDGLWGPVTEEAFAQLEYYITHGTLPNLWRPEDMEDNNPNHWPKQYSDEFYAFYGEMGQHLVDVQLPYPHKIAWNTSQVIHSFKCHKKVKESIERVLHHVLQHYSLNDIRQLRLDSWGGCYNKRPIRGGTKWSMHSWGIAIDYDPARNKLQWGRDKASFAKPEYAKWWECWEEEGWISLGRQRNFDWMHVQAAKL